MRHSMKVLRKWQQHSGRSRRRRGIDTTIHLSVHLSIHPSIEGDFSSKYHLLFSFKGFFYLALAPTCFSLLLFFVLYFLCLSFTYIFSSYLYLYSFLSRLLHHCPLYSLLLYTVVTLSHQVLVDHYHNDNDVEFVFKRTLGTVLYTYRLTTEKLFPGH